MRSSLVIFCFVGFFIACSVAKTFKFPSSYSATVASDTIPTGSTNIYQDGKNQRVRYQFFSNNGVIYEDLGFQRDVNMTWYFFQTTNNTQGPCESVNSVEQFPFHWTPGEGCNYPTYGGKIKKNGVSCNYFLSACTFQSNVTTNMTYYMDANTDAPVSVQTYYTSTRSTYSVSYSNVMLGVPDPIVFEIPGDCNEEDVVVASKVVQAPHVVGLLSRPQ